MTERPDQPGTPPDPRPDPVDLTVEAEIAATVEPPEKEDAVKDHPVEPPILDKPLEDPPHLDTPYTPPPPAARGMRRSLVAGVSAIVLVGAGAVLWHLYGDENNGGVVTPIAAPASGGTTTTAGDDRLATVERALSGLDRRLEALESRVADLPAGDGAGLEELRSAIADLRERQGVLEESFTAVDPGEAVPEEAPGGTSGGSTIADAALSSRIASLEAKLAELARPTVDPADIAALQRDIAALKAQNAETAQRVAAETDRLASVGRGVSLVYAIGRLRGAVALSAPYAAALASVRGHFDALDLTREPAIGKALDGLAANADKGLPSRAELAASFAPLARSAVQASQVPEDADLADRLLAEAGNLITVRPIGEVEGEDVPARVARAEVRLSRGDLEGALQEVRGFTGSAAAVLAPWLVQAEARLAAEGAVDLLDGEVSARFAEAN